MKIAKILITTIVFLFIFNAITFAQFVQNGKTMEYNRRQSKKTFVLPVSLMFEGASSTYNDDEGNFQLMFGNITAGRKINNYSINLNGRNDYVVFNHNEINDWILTKDKSLEIVFCKKEIIDYLTKTYTDNYVQSLKRKLEETKVQLQNSINDNEELDRKILELESNYRKDLEEIKARAILFAYVDEEKISSIELDIREAILQGDFKKAYELGETLNYNKVADDRLNNFEKILKLAEKEADDLFNLSQSIETHIKNIQLIKGRGDSELCNYFHSLITIYTKLVTTYESGRLGTTKEHLSFLKEKLGNAFYNYYDMRCYRKTTPFTDELLELACYYNNIDALLYNYKYGLQKPQTYKGKKEYMKRMYSVVTNHEDSVRISELDKLIIDHKIVVNKIDTLSFHVDTERKTACLNGIISKSNKTIKIPQNIMVNEESFVVDEIDCGEYSHGLLEIPIVIPKTVQLIARHSFLFWPRTSSFRCNQNKEWTVEVYDLMDYTFTDHSKLFPKPLIIKEGTTEISLDSDGIDANIVCKNPKGLSIYIEPYLDYEGKGEISEIILPSSLVSITDEAVEKLNYCNNKVLTKGKFKDFFKKENIVIENEIADDSKVISANGITYSALYDRIYSISNAKDLYLDENIEICTQYKMEDDHDYYSYVSFTTDFLSFKWEDRKLSHEIVDDLYWLLEDDKFSQDSVVIHFSDKANSNTVFSFLVNWGYSDKAKFLTKYNSTPMLPDTILHHHPEIVNDVTDDLLLYDVGFSYSPLSKQCLHRACELGNEKARWLLRILEFNNKESTIEQVLQQNIAEGDKQSSLRILAWIYGNPSFGLKDDIKTENCLRLLLEQKEANNPNTNYLNRRYILAELAELSFIHGTTEDTIKCVRYLEEAVTLGNKKAIVSLGHYYYLKQEWKKSFDYYMESLESEALNMAAYLIAYNKIDITYAKEIISSKYKYFKNEIPQLFLINKCIDKEKYTANYYDSRGEIQLLLGQDGWYDDYQKAISVNKTFYSNTESPLKEFAQKVEKEGVSELEILEFRIKCGEEYKSAYDFGWMLATGADNYILKKIDERIVPILSGKIKKDTAKAIEYLQMAKNAGNTNADIMLTKIKEGNDDKMDLYTSPYDYVKMYKSYISTEDYVMAMEMLNKIKYCTPSDFEILNRCFVNEFLNKRLIYKKVFYASESDFKFFSYSFYANRKDESVYAVFNEALRYFYEKNLDLAMNNLKKIENKIGSSSYFYEAQILSNYAYEHYNLTDALLTVDKALERLQDQSVPLEIKLATLMLKGEILYKLGDKQGALSQKKQIESIDFNYLFRNISILNTIN